NSEEEFNVADIDDSIVDIRSFDPAIINFTINSSDINLEISNNEESDDSVQTITEADDSIERELRGIRDQFNETRSNFSDDEFELPKKSRKSRSLSNSSSSSIASASPTSITNKFELLSTEEKKSKRQSRHRRRAKLFSPVGPHLRAISHPPGFYRETKPTFRPRTKKTYDSNDSDYHEVREEIPVEEIAEVFDEVMQAELEELRAKYADLQATERSLRERLNTRESLQNDPVPGTSTGTGGVSAKQLCDILAVNNSTFAEEVAKQFSIYVPQPQQQGGRGGGGGGRNQDFVPQPTCLIIPKRNYNLAADSEELSFGIPGTRSLLKISPVVFSSVDNSNHNKATKTILQNARLKSWTAGKDHRCVEEFIVEFENEIRQLVKTNQEYNIGFDHFLDSPDLLNFKKQMKVDTPWHENAIKLIKMYSNVREHSNELKCFNESVKKPQQSAVDYATFWLRRLHWNSSVEAKYVSEVLLEDNKIGMKYREIFKECSPTDSIEDLIEKITKLEFSGTSKEKNIDASSYYHQVTKPMLDKEKKSYSNKDGSSSSKSSSGSSSNKEPPKPSSNKPNPFEKFKKGQLLKYVSSKDGKYQLKKIESIKEVENEPNAQIYIIDQNHQLVDYVKPKEHEPEPEGATKGRSSTFTRVKPTKKFTLPNASIVNTKNAPIVPPVIPEIPKQKEPVYLFCDGILYIGSNVMFRFLRQYDKKPACNLENYKLVGDNLTAKKVNQLFDEHTFDIPPGVEHAIIHLGLQESIFKKLDSSIFQMELEKLIMRLRDNYQLKHIVLALIAPTNFAVPTVEYWETLEEVNKTIYFTAGKQDKCLFWNAFSPFVKRNELIPNEKRWFKYVAEGNILYDIKRELYQGGVNPKTAKADLAGWKIFELNKLQYEMCSFMKKFCHINIFESTKPQPKDENLDHLYGRTDAPVVFNLNDSIIDVLQPVDIEYSNKDISPKIKVQFGKIEIDALIDNGCSHVLMNENAYERILAEYPEYKKSEVKAEGMGQKFTLAATKSHPKINKMAYLSISFPTQKPNKSVYNIQVFIVKDLNAQLIIGRNLMRAFEMVIFTAKNYIELTDPANTSGKNRTFTIPYQEAEKVPVNFELKPDPKQQPLKEVHFINFIKPEEIFSISENPEYVIETELRYKIEEAVEGTELSQKHKGTLRKHLYNNYEPFENRIGLCNCYEHRFAFVGNKLPPPHKVWCKTRPIPHRYEDGVHEIIRKWKEEGKVVERQSPYKLGLVYVDKGGGKVRICLDGRPLNEFIYRHSTEPPNINHMRMKFKDANYFTIFDFNNGFMQIKVVDDQQCVLSFTVDGIPLVMTVVGFGTEDSLAAFVYALRLVLRGCEDFTGVYVDDVIIYSKTIEEHLEHIRIFLEKVKAAGMTLNLRKTQWCRRKIKYLGMIFSDEGVQVDPEKIEPILNFELPKDVKCLQQFLGMFQYYREYMPRISLLCEPLYAMIAKKGVFIWTEENIQCFNLLKQELANETLLTYPDFSKPFYVYTDASTKAIGGVVMQPNRKNGKELMMPIAFTSRVLKGYEKSYSVMELELLAVVHLLAKNYYLLAGNEVNLYTDNIAVTYLKKNQLLPNRIIKWLLYLDNFRINIRHIAGADNSIADFLSRYSFNITENDKNFTIFLFDYVTPKCLYTEFRRLRSIQNNDTAVQNWIAKAPERVRIDDNLKLIVFQNQNDQEWRIFIPSNLQLDIINHYHYDYGHVGITKLIRIIRRHFDWPGLTSQVQQYVNGCISCQVSMRTTSRMYGPIQSITSDNFNHILCLDNFGPIPSSTAGVDHVFVIEDHFTKYVRLYPMKVVTSTNIIDRMEKWMAEFGCPKIILSDNGPQFSSKLWRKYWLKKNVQIRYTSRYTPNSNPAERIMSTLGSSIRKYLSDKQKAWCRIIPDIERKLNYTESAVTGCIPYEAVKGRLVPDPLVEIVKKRKLPENLHQKIFDNQRKEIEKRREYFSKVHPPVRLKEGDRVFVKNRVQSSKEKGVAAKLSHQWKGPYKIVSKPWINVYELEDENRPGYIIRENIRHLKKYDKATDDPETPPIE
ncbi:unnamed protein product, partial [Allacma fusca]